MAKKPIKQYATLTDDSGADALSVATGGAVTAGPSGLSTATQHTINGALGSFRSAGIFMENATTGGSSYCALSATTFSSTSGAGVAKTLGSATDFEGAVFVCMSNYGISDIFMCSGSSFNKLTASSSSWLAGDSGSGYRMYVSGGVMYFKDSSSGFSTRSISIFVMNPEGVRITNVT
jgi:hypothetical protein